MGGDRAAPAVGASARPPAGNLAAPCGERNLLHRPELLSVADAAQGVPAVHDGAVLFLSLARRWNVVEHQPRAGDASARIGRARGEPDGRGHRQPVGEDDGGGRAARL